jgi:hypothetical protein
MGHHKMPDLLLILNPLKKKVSIKSYTQKTFEYSTSTQVIRQKPNFFYHISLIAFSHDFLTLFQRIQNNIKFYVFYNEYIEFCQKTLLIALKPTQTKRQKNGKILDISSFNCFIMCLK